MLLFVVSQLLHLLGFSSVSFLDLPWICPGTSQAFQQDFLSSLLLQCCSLKYCVHPLSPINFFPSSELYIDFMQFSIWEVLLSSLLNSFQMCVFLLSKLHPIFSSYLSLLQPTASNTWPVPLVPLFSLFSRIFRVLSVMFPYIQLHNFFTDQMMDKNMNCVYFPGQL